MKIEYRFKQFKRHLQFMTLASTLSLSIPLYAETKNTSDDTNNDWQFTVAPYVWAVNMNGNVQIGNTRARMSESFNDILDQLQWGGMLYLEAHKDKFGLFFNALYSVLSETDSTNQITMKTDFGLFSGGISYDWLKKSLNENSQITLAPYAGFRTTINNLHLSAPGISASNDHHWTDPIVGASLNYEITQSWSAILAADAGGTSNDDYSYNLQGLIGFSPEKLKQLTVYLGYRFLDQYYLSGSGSSLFSWKMQTQGPLVGLAYTF